ncbi:glycosyl hydrolase family 65 protein [Micromonospora tulbaghiae]
MIRLPPALSHLEFNLAYRGHWLHCHCSHDVVSVEVLPSAASPVTIILNDVPHVVSGGDRISVPAAGRHR